MDALKLKYLGTSAAEGVPGVFCNCLNCKNAMENGAKNIRMRSSALINGRLLIDLSPDFAAVKAKCKIDTSLLEAALVTHTHQDHFNYKLLSYSCSSFAEKTSFFRQKNAAGQCPAVSVCYYVRIIQRG